jgi:hypothetical protein
MALLAKMDGVTLLGLGSSAPIHPEWQAIFWPSDALQNSVEGAVQGRMGAAGVTGLRSILKELQGSQVGLVWSSIGESDKRGSLYWYDPTEAGEGGGQIDLDEAATILTEVAAFLRK